MDDNEIQEEGGLIDRIKESPRTVSALIIILIVAAAIYAFSGDEGGQVSDVDEQQQGEAIAEVTEGDSDSSKIEEEEDEDAIETTSKKSEGDEETQEPKVAAETTTAKPQAISAKAEQEPIAEPHRTDKGFVEVAEAGNGVTHLARRASSRWLSENQASYAVTDEHRIYIEDYIQNRTESNGLALGDTVEIGFDLIEEAVAAAEELSESQLNNLSQYTHVLQ